MTIFFISFSYFCLERNGIPPSATSKPLPEDSGPVRDYIGALTRKVRSHENENVHPSTFTVFLLFVIISIVSKICNSRSACLCHDLANFYAKYYVPFVFNCHHICLSIVVGASVMGSFRQGSKAKECIEQPKVKEQETDDHGVHHSQT